MTHEEMVTEFLSQNFKSGNIVELVMNDESIITGILSDHRVNCDTTAGGEKINSRIGLIMPPKQFATPIYTEKVLKILKIDGVK